MTFRPGSGSFCVVLKDASGDTFEGTTIAVTTAVSKALSVPWAVKGGGIFMKVGTSATAGVQPGFQVSFDADAETPSWTNVTNDANTSAAASFSAFMAEDTDRFEWFGFHIPAAWKKASGSTTSTQKVDNVMWRVAFNGEANVDQDITLARAFLIKSIV